MNLETIKNTYAQEKGYEDWKELREELYGYMTELRIEAYMDEICIRTQKLALEKAAENVWNNGGEDVEKICPSITNAENLIL